MTDKIAIHLKGVPQTLLLPLVGRALFSKEPYSPIHDKKAVELINEINYDFGDLMTQSQVRRTSLFWLARAYHFDEAIKSHLKEHPNAVIVNLGCGLDTTFNRVDNGHLTWVNVDLPEVIDLRQKLLPPSKREYLVARSVLDFSWMDEVRQYGRDVFFFAGGLFMYFTEEENKKLFSTMADHFPGSKLIFDNIAPAGLKRANEMLARSGMKDAVLKWSVRNGKELETWSPNIRLAAQFPYFRHLKSKFSFPLAYKMSMYFFDFYHDSGIICLQF